MFRKGIFAGGMLGLMVILLAACGNVQPTPTPTVVVTPTAAVTSSPVVSPTAPVSSGTPTAPRPTPPIEGWNSKVAYEVTGGIAGIKRMLLVGPVGQARLIEGTKNSGPVKLSAERLAQVKAKLDAVDFFNLQDHYGNGTVSDDFLITISVTQDDQTKTVQVEEQGGKGVTPQALLDFIDDLEDLRMKELEPKMVDQTPTAVATATVVVGPTQTSEPRVGWNVTLSFSKGGGFAPVDQKLDIASQGNATLKERGTTVAQTTIAPEELGKIMSSLNSANFFTLEDSYGTAVPDGFVYSLTITQNGQTKTVNYFQGSESTPAEVRALFGTVEGVAEGLKGVATPTVTAP